ncbi:MAG TPA: class E sortase [Terrimesophilobacter sp.]|nr:class E sortase [Terrimesophilobacter sp.]
MADDPIVTRKALAQVRRRRLRRVSVVGVLGELLITAGVLVFLFLGWQLWLNDVIVGDEQNHVAAEIAQTWDAGNFSLNREPTTVDYGDPVVTPASGNAETFAVMYVPRFGKDWVRQVAEGIGIQDVLNTKRIGHYPETQLPGELGNFALAAHRLTYGAPFRDIDQLRLGDKLYVMTKDGYYTYSFRNLEYVGPRGVGVLDPVPQSSGETAGERLLTIMSCNPKWSVAERIVAYAILDSWQPISAGPPEAIADLVNAKG